ncbi:MAG: hypothetical protein RR128_08470 [Clostridium sp.]
MINVNFESLLNTMGKAQIMAMFESQLDTAVAQKIERENAEALYQKAKAAVANDTYTSDDLVILQKRLNDVKRLNTKTISFDKDFMDGAGNIFVKGEMSAPKSRHMPKPQEPELKVMSPTEADTLLALLGFPVPPKDGRCTFDE